jgi:Ca2+-binding EF-hand superfamily protein
MRTLEKTLAVVALGAAIMSAPAAFAQKSTGETMDADHFVKMCDTDKDGMVSKAEMMKMVEKAWEKADKKKAGKIDKQQAEFFLRELMKSGG